MKYGIFVVTWCIILFCLFFGSEVHLNYPYFSIHIHDTYFEFYFWTFILIALFFLFFIFSLTAALTSKFRKKIFNIFLFCSTISVVICFLYIKN